MILVEKTLGNIKDSVWDTRSGDLTIDYLVLEQWEAPKSRLRKNSEGGVEIAISLSRSDHLHNGDVLYYDEGKKLVVVARIALKEVMVIELEGLEKLGPQEILHLCFDLGHGLGNQHWPAVIKGTNIYVPLSVDQKVMASVMKTHAYSHVKIHFAPGEEIASLLDASEVRLLFAGADATPHHHHGQSQRHGHKHHHDHDDDHNHHSHDDHERAHTHHHHHDDDHPEREHEHTHRHTHG